jgi:hypothetical protein
MFVLLFLCILPFNERDRTLDDFWTLSLRSAAYMLRFNTRLRIALEVLSD